MKKILPLFLFTFAVPVFADVVSVSVPACFLYEFQSLESAVAQVKTQATDLCLKTANGTAMAVITQTRVEQTASCRGFKILATVECVAP